MEVKFEIDDAIWDKFCVMCEVLNMEPEKLACVLVSNVVLFSATRSSEETDRILKEAPVEVIDMVRLIISRAQHEG